MKKNDRISQDKHESLGDVRVINPKGRLIIQSLPC